MLYSLTPVVNTSTILLRIWGKKNYCWVSKMQYILSKAQNSYKGMVGAVKDCHESHSIRRVVGEWTFTLRLDCEGLGFGAGLGLGSRGGGGALLAAARRISSSCCWICCWMRMSSLSSPCWGTAQWQRRAVNKPAYQLIGGYGRAFGKWFASL